MKPSETLEMHREMIREILSRYPVSNPRIFGSVARGEDTEASDLDILVKLDTQPNAATSLTLMDLARLQIELQKATDRRIDVSLEDGFSQRVLERLSRSAIAL
ncbi:MAG: nucleotidyltransferase [Fulvimarina sp.]|nr:nucleotidyltransferase [Fulvimarina sp.]